MKNDLQYKEKKYFEPIDMSQSIVYELVIDDSAIKGFLKISFIWRLEVTWIKNTKEITDSFIQLSDNFIIAIITLPVQKTNF